MIFFNINSFIKQKVHLNHLLRNLQIVKKNIFDMNNGYVIYREFILNPCSRSECKRVFFCMFEGSYDV
jgi:hypothetical protein